MKIKVEVTKEYEIEVDESNYIVQEYENRDALISDLVAYAFNVLPVMDEGVKVINVETINIEHYQI